VRIINSGINYTNFNACTKMTFGVKLVNTGHFVGGFGVRRDLRVIRACQDMLVCRFWRRVHNHGVNAHNTLNVGELDEIVFILGGRVIVNKTLISTMEYENSRLGRLQRQCTHHSRIR
jgi:hypothetical protein